MPLRPTAMRAFVGLLAIAGTTGGTLVSTAAAVVPDKPLPVKTWLTLKQCA